MDRKLPPLTAQDFYKYLKCPNWAYWDLFGDPALKGEVPEMIRRLREEGVLHERAVVAALGAFEEMPAGTDEEAAAATLAAMKRGVPAIYQGTLMHGDWVGRPDLLLRTETPSDLGAWSYEAVDIKSSHELKDEHKLQLIFYALLLKRVQGVRPEEGKIVNVEGRTLAFRIEDDEALFFDVLEKLLKIRAGEMPEPLFTSGCKESPWYEQCKKRAEEAQDVSLIYKIYKNEARRLREAGYGSLQALASASPEALHELVRGVPDHRLDRLQLQARSLIERRAIRVADPMLPEAPLELHFDIEGDPLRGVEYLFGVLERSGGEARYRAFLSETDRKEDEGKAWTAFCDYMETVEGAPIYHYGWYELDAIRRLSARHGISRAAARALETRNMIDLNRVIQRSAILPLYFYSLKDVARHLGFSWRAADASGANSVVWFQEWLEKGDRALLRKIVDYNEDDVRATAFVKDWLTKGE